MCASFDTDDDTYNDGDDSVSIALRLLANKE
jgi:hypothetical protein